MITRYIKIIGRVQGVGFRRWAERTAEKYHISGWVRNLSDGSVEIMMKGETADVDAFLSACQSGPAFASVIGVQPVVIPTSTPPPVHDGVFESVASA
ncbi:MAG: acylphosphatase [Alphaproteobacteria bacterium]|nr:acylphosphatase [Alphaproteobacteria bacterium]